MQTSSACPTGAGASCTPPESAPGQAGNPAAFGSLVMIQGRAGSVRATLCTVASAASEHTMPLDCECSRT